MSVMGGKDGGESVGGERIDGESIGSTVRVWKERRD
jgi:hypothetical protein